MIFRRSYQTPPIPGENGKRRLGVSNNVGEAKMKKLASLVTGALLLSAPAHAVDIEVAYPYSHLFDVTYEKIMKDFKKAIRIST